jgi:hypothetical protein
MSRRRKLVFVHPKMFSARVENEKFVEFEKIIRYQYNLDLQEIVNLFVNQFVTGDLFLSGLKFYNK